MLLIKILLQIIIIASLINANTKIILYNQGNALITENRKVDLEKIGRQNLTIQNFPINVNPSSINLYSKNIDFFSKDFFYKPITIKSMLNSYVGKKIELVKYDTEGNISFTTIGKLISNINQPVFEINNKIAINPPYDYLFNNIPEGILDYPYLNCIINSKYRKSDFNLSYIAEGISWTAEYNIKLLSENKCNFEGWYFIQNDLNILYEDVEISMVSGEINFEKLSNPLIQSNNRLKTATNYLQDIKKPIISKAGEYFIFHLPEKINLSPQSQSRYKFVENYEIPYKNIYHISHSLQRLHRKMEKNNENIPVNVRVEIMSKNIGNFQLPAGAYQVYNKHGDALTFVGFDQSPIITESNNIKIETGRTYDVLSRFTLKVYDINRDAGEVEMNVVFENNKSIPVEVIWTENLIDGKWDIYNSNYDYKRIDAHTIQFNVIISENSKKEINLKAHIEKK